MEANYFPTRLMCENEKAIVTPLPGGAYIQKLNEIVGGAKMAVDVVQYQWNWYPYDPNNPLQKFNVGVLGLARRGVKFRVLLNVEVADHRLTRINQQAQRNLKQVGIKVKFGPQFPITHAKIFIVDSNFVILGSHNLSKRSVTVNDETSVLIKSKEVAKEYLRYFNVLWNKT